MAKNVVKDKKVEAHVYEYTTQYSLNPDLKLQSLEKGIVPVSPYTSTRKTTLIREIVDPDHVLPQGGGTSSSSLLLCAY